MTEDKEFTPIVEHKTSKVLYEYLGRQTFRNLVTGKEGEVPEEVVAKAFHFPIEINETVEAYPETRGLFSLGWKVNVVHR